MVNDLQRLHSSLSKCFQMEIGRQSFNSTVGLLQYMISSLKMSMTSVWADHLFVGLYSGSSSCCCFSPYCKLCCDQTLIKSLCLAANEEYYQLLMINDSQPSGLDVSSYTIEEIDGITSEYTLKNNVSHWIIFQTTRIRPSFELHILAYNFLIGSSFEFLSQQDIFAVAVSLNTGRIVYISDQAASILNCKRDVFKDTKFVEFLTPQDVSVFYSFTTPYRLPSWSMCTGAGTYTSLQTRCYNYTRICDRCSH